MTRTIQQLFDLTGKTALVTAALVAWACKWRTPSAKPAPASC
jgi:hypothetical protein